MFDSEKIKKIFKGLAIGVVTIGLLWLLFPEIPKGIQEKIENKRTNTIKANLEEFYDCKIDDISIWEWENGKWEIDGKIVHAGKYYQYNADSGENEFMGTVDENYKPIALWNEIDIYAEDIVNDVSQIIENTTDIENYGVVLERKQSFNLQSVVTSYEDYLNLDYTKTLVRTYIYLPLETDIQNIYKLNREFIKFGNLKDYTYRFVDDETIQFINDSEPISDGYRRVNWKDEFVGLTIDIYNLKNRTTDLGDIEFVLDYGTENEQIVLKGYKSLLGYVDVYEGVEDEEFTLVFDDEYVKEIDNIVEKNPGHTISIVKNNHCLSNTKIIEQDISGTLKLNDDDFVDDALAQVLYQRPNGVERFQDLKKKGKVEKELGKVDFILNYGRKGEQKILEGYKFISAYYFTDRTSDYLMISVEDNYVKELDDIVANNIGNTITIVKDDEFIGTLEVKESYTSGIMVLYFVKSDDSKAYSGRDVINKIF